MAAHLRKVLDLDVDMIHGRYGEFTVLVDDEVVVDAGALAVIGIMPTKRHVLAIVQERLSRPPSI